jgi:hypothetical protein
VQVHGDTQELATYGADHVGFDGANAACDDIETHGEGSGGGVQVTADVEEGVVE